VLSILAATPKLTCHFLEIFHQLHYHMAVSAAFNIASYASSVKANSVHANDIGLATG
jgi:hypothetical protein